MSAQHDGTLLDAAAGAGDAATEVREDALLKAGALQRAIFNSANFSSIATDAAGVIQIFNVGAERMLGYTAADVLNKFTMADLHDPQEAIARAAALSIELGTPIAPGFEALVFKAARGIEDIYELTKVRKDASRFPAVVSVTALRDAQDSIIGYLFIGTDNTARKQAEVALLEAGALQRAIFNSANFSSIATDASGVIQIFNVGAERMLGYAAADVLNKITPADISDPQQVVARATALSVELGTPITPGFEALVFKASRGIEDIYELTYIRKDGTRFPAIVSVTALRDAQDAIIGYLLIGTDNTARKQAEEALLKAGALQRAIFNSANFSSIATDAKGVIQIFNVGAERMLGYAAADVMNKVTPADISDAQEVIARATALSLEFATTITPGFEALVFKASRGIEDIYELTYCRKDGSRFPAVVSVTALRDAQNAIIGYLLIGTDNTARKQVEQEVRRTSAFMTSIVQNIPATIFVKDARDLRYVQFNRAGEELLGVKADEVLGCSDYDLFPRDEADAYVATDRQALAARDIVDILEQRMETGAKGVRVLHTKKIPIFDEHDRPQFLLGISEDITERKEAERKILAAQAEAERANRAKSDFLSRMSHDLRTPLNAILGFAQLLELDDLGEKANESVAQILTGGQHLLALINEVLDIARIEAGHLSLSPQPVSAVDVVNDVVDLVRPLAVARGIALQIETPVHDLVVHADRLRLSQILLNLLSNAVKYNRPNGRVTASFREIDGGRARVAVTDNGPGILPAKLALLFRPFERLGAEQTSVEGTGLGLALSRGLAEAMGGALGVESIVDRGTTFWVELAKTDAPPRVAVALATAAVAAQGATAGVVLYVEDNLPNVRLMERVLERRPGVRLVHAPTGEDGVRLARTEQPGLILLDLHLPDMGGEEVLQRLWEEPDLRAIPVAILSADATPEHIRRLDASGAVAYLTKPLEIRQLMQLIDEWLRPGAVR